MGVEGCVYIGFGAEKVLDAGKDFLIFGGVGVVGSGSDKEEGLLCLFKGWEHVGEDVGDGHVACTVGEEDGESFVFYGGGE